MKTKITISRSGSSARSQHNASHWLWFKSVAAAALVVLPCVLFGGCSTISPAYSPAFVPSDPAAPHYDNGPMQEGDVISVTFQYSTNFNTVQRIGLDGRVNLESVGQVKAAGKTVHDFQNELSALYKPELKDDPITVKVITPAAAIYVTGAVNRPGKIQMERPMTVMDAIVEAGGFEPYRAKLSKVSILRIENGSQAIYWVNLERVLNGQEKIPFYLKPFDIVRIPTKTFNF